MLVLAFCGWSDNVQVSMKKRDGVRRAVTHWLSMQLAASFHGWLADTKRNSSNRALATRAVAFWTGRSVSSSFNTWADLANFDRVVSQATRLGQYVPQDAIANVRGSLGRQQAQQRLVEWACSLMRCDRASIFLVDVKTEELVIHGTSGAGTRIPLAAGIAGISATTGEYLLVNDPYSDPDSKLP